MMQAIEGIYQNGHIKLLEIPKRIRRSRVVVTFLDDEAKELEPQTSIVGTVEILDDNGGLQDDRTSVVGLGEIVDDDLEAASLEIRQMFLDSIEKSGDELGQ